MCILLAFITYKFLESFSTKTFKAFLKSPNLFYVPLLCDTRFTQNNRWRASHAAPLTHFSPYSSHIVSLSRIQTFSLHFALCLQQIKWPNQTFSFEATHPSSFAWCKEILHNVPKPKNVLKCV